MRPNLLFVLTIVVTCRKAPWQKESLMPRLSRLSAALCTTLCAFASAAGAPANAADAASRHHGYRLVDAGFFGIGFGIFSNPASNVVNRGGAAAGMNSTPAPDRFAPNCFFNCHVDHAFLWRDGGTLDLGALATGVSSFPYSINDSGSVVGVSQTGAVDPVTGFPETSAVRWSQETSAVRWSNGPPTDLGRLGGTQGAANSINRKGEIVGASLTAAPDPFAGVSQRGCLWLPTTGPGCGSSDFAFNALFAPGTTQTHAVLWSGATMKDLGTLGGPDSTATNINGNCQVIGWSYTSFTAGPKGVPEVRPFMWDRVNGMVRLGSLGGTMGAASFINERGQVVGVSNLAGDAVMHAVLWNSPTQMVDLGTLEGGTYAHPDWINKGGDVVGYSNTGQHNGRAFLWHAGHMRNLGTIGDDPASEAFSINTYGQIVGLTFVPGGRDLRGWISYQGGPLIDLNTLIRDWPSDSKIQVISAVEINDDGEIVGQGKLPNGDIHAIVLIPE
ncbi:MAG: hypothetical protein ACR2FH_02780 [Caulobacteraceae bacterium]